MKLFINTGGKGVRLGGLTHDIPKPMLRLADRPVLEHTVLWAKENGINEIVMLNGFLHEEIEKYFCDGGGFGVKITHSNEPGPLGSGGCVKYGMKHAGGTFVLISGDVICRVDLKKMLASHREAGDAIMTVFLHESDHPHDSDVLQTDSNGRVVKFIGRKDDHTGAGSLANAGLFVIEPRVIDFMEDDVFTFETYLFPRFLAANEYVNAYVTDEYIKDMGTPERLARVEEYLRNEQSGVS